MTSQIRAPVAPQFSIGRVLKDTLRVLGRNFIPFSLVAIVLTLPWGLGYQANAAMDSFGTDQWSWPRFVVDSFLSDALSALLQLVLLFAVLRTLRGERVLAGDYALGLRSLPSVLIASAIISLPGLVGDLSEIMLDQAGYIAQLATAALAFFAVIVRIVLWVVTPSVAAERRAVVDGVARSIQLTRGRRWKIFGLMLIPGFMLMLVLVVLPQLSGVPVGTMATFPLTSIRGLLFFVVVVYSNAIFAIMMSVSYHHLRIEKDGVDPDRVVQVFD
jgi:hypothetical protein